MAKLVVLITSRSDEVHGVGEAWQKAGAPGVTFIEGYGLGKLQEASRSGEILTGMLSLFEILRDNEETSMILLSLVENAAIVDSLLSATEVILGSMLTPKNGVFFVVDVERAVGVRYHQE